MKRGKAPERSRKSGLTFSPISEPRQSMKYASPSSSSSSNEDIDERLRTLVGSESEREMSSNDEDEEGEENDVDAPRIAQWEPEDDDTVPSDLRNVSDKGEGSSRKALINLRKGLTAMPFQTLLKARRVVEQVRNDSDSGSSDSSGEDDREEREPSAERHEDREKWMSGPSKKVEKRSNKHAPLEMSSKRPVSRRRQVVEVKKVNYRDPRFSPLSGELQPAVYEKRYGFLADLHKSELSALKENLKRANKMLRSSPRDQREEREEEVQRLERAVKRAESSVNRDRRERVEREALSKLAQEEREKRKAGKGEWYLKDSEKKELLIRARHDALAQQGGRLAVKKAIEKKQKKISQKEKKRRPAFLSRSDRNEPTGLKRRSMDGSHHENKRRKMSIDVS